jgi:hypothetical protein
LCASTFNNYMCINARRELTILEEKELSIVINQ